jgi:hypothetical protein
METLKKFKDLIIGDYLIFVSKKESDIFDDYDYYGNESKKNLVRKVKIQSIQEIDGLIYFNYKVIEKTYSKNEIDCALCMDVDSYKNLTILDCKESIAYSDESDMANQLRLFALDLLAKEDQSVLNYKAKIEKRKQEIRLKYYDYLNNLNK